MLESESKKCPGNKVFLGLAGTGKSCAMIREVETLVHESDIKKDEICILSFNRNIKENRMQDTEISNRGNTFTVHSLAYEVLKSVGLLPEVFDNSSRERIESRFEKAKVSPARIESGNFDELIQRFIKLDASNVRRYRAHLKLICVDEYQDLREDYVALVKKLVKVYDCKVFLAGDPHQRIYTYQNKRSKYKIGDNFKTLENDLGIKDFQYEILNENHRATRCNIRFLNGFLAKTLVQDSSLLYSLPDSVEEGEEPELVYFTHQKDELNYVQEQIAGLNNEEDILILSRYRRQIGSYKVLFENDSRVTISTIHEEKGSEASTVFLVGFDVDFETRQDEDQFSILYVALSRCKKKLFITSPFPVPSDEHLNSLFDQDTYAFRSFQEQSFKNNAAFEIDDTISYSLKSYQKSCIDSILLKVKADDAPFLPYVERGNVRQNRYGNRKTVFDVIEFDIEYYHACKQYVFSFLDLNLLKRNGLNDWQILDFLLQRVQKYFDFRLDAESISIRRLDLCRLHNCRSELEVSSIYRNLFKETKAKKILDHGRGRYTKTYCGSFRELRNKTLYFNHHSNKHYGLTTKVYFPERKTNENKLPDPDVVKVEVKANRQWLENKKILGNDLSLKKLMTMDLKKLRDDWLKKYHPHLDFDFAPKHKRGIVHDSGNPESIRSISDQSLGSNFKNNSTDSIHTFSSA